MRVKGRHVVAVRQRMALGLDIRTHPALPREDVQFVADVGRSRPELAADTIGELPWIFHRSCGLNAWLTLPAQPVNATPSSALVRQCFRGRTVRFAVLGQNLAKAAFLLV